MDLQERFYKVMRDKNVFDADSALLFNAFKILSFNDLEALVGDLENMTEDELISFLGDVKANIRNFSL